MKWGVYPWFVEQGIELIHPDDIEDFKKEANNCKVFMCVEEGEYITLKYNNRCYRVRDVLFKIVPTPEFTYGQTVKIRDTNEEVMITDIMWHFSKQEHYYFVNNQSNKKKKTKRYFASELI